MKSLVLNVFNADAALIAGQARGIFARRGLDIDVRVTPNSSEQMRGLGAGSWQLVSTAFDNVLGWSGRDRIEMIAVAQVAQGVLLPVYVRPEIRGWEDLRGKALAVDAVDTAYALVLRRVLLAHGLDLRKGDYRLVPRGATGHRLESMKAGETFAAVLNPPWDGEARAAGLVRLADHREVLPNYPGGVFAVARRWADAQRALLVDYLRAWHEGLQWARAEDHREEAIGLIAHAEKLDRSAAEARLRQLPESGRLNLGGLQCVLDLRVQFGLTPAMGEALSVYYDESFYREASNE